MARQRTVPIGLHVSGVSGPGLNAGPMHGLALAAAVCDPALLPALTPWAARMTAPACPPSWKALPHDLDRRP